MDNTGFTVPPKLYDFLKWIALVVLPAVAALVLGLGVLLHWSGATVTAGVITLVDTFLGSTLKKSSTNFANQNVFGDLIVQQDAGGTPVGMRIVGAQENPILKDQSTVLLNVKREQAIE